MALKRKRIKLRHGQVKRLVEMTGYSKMTVSRALNWHADTDAENEVRALVKKYNMIRKF